MEKKISILVMDVDGTLTDGKIHIASTGELFKETPHNPIKKSGTNRRHLKDCG